MLTALSIDGVIVSLQGGALTMAEKRDGVFVWITWLARVMAGEQVCEWASWLPARVEVRVHLLGAPISF